MQNALHSAPNPMAAMSSIIRTAVLSITLSLTLLCIITPAQTQSAPPFLKAAAAPVSKIAKGAAGQIIVTLSIAAPFHIQANPPSKDMIATVVTPLLPQGFTTGKIRYPAGLRRTVVGQSILVYERTAKIVIPITVKSSVVPKSYTIPIVVKYQGCDNNTCYPPAQLNAVAQVTVTAEAAKPKVGK